jgi:hypothetical protein
MLCRRSGGRTARPIELEQNIGCGRCSRRWAWDWADSHAPDQMTCRICNQPLTLGIDTVADEDGKSVHETCYTKQITEALHNHPADPAAD